MKKMFMLALVSMLVGTASAQLQRGNFLIGSDLARFNLSLEEGGLFAIDLNPKVAFFVSNNLALGVYLHFGLLTAKGAGASVDYGIGALGRYYISDPNLNVLRRSRFFFEATAGIEGDNPASGNTTNGLGLGVGPGFAYFITPNVGLETLAKFQGIVGFGNETTASNVLLGVGLQIYLGSARAKQRVQETKTQ